MDISVPFAALDASNGGSHSLGGLPTGGSKAVLAALKSLQEKIKKLEHERDQHHDNYESLKVKYEAYKAETQASLQGRDAKESHLQSIITRLEEEMDKLKEERVAAQSGHQSAIHQLAESKVRHDRLLDAATQEARQTETRLQTQLNQANEEILSLKATVAKLDSLSQERLEKFEAREQELLDALQETDKAKRQGWEQQLSSERKLTETSQIQKQQLEATVSDLIKLNSSLFNQITQLTSEPKPTKKVKKATNKRQTSCTRARTLTGSQRSRSPTASFAGKTRSSSVPHYSGDHSAWEAARSPRFPAAIQERLTKANLGQQVPFLLGSSLLSHNTVANAQMGIDISREPIDNSRDVEPHCHSIPEAPIENVDEFSTALQDLVLQVENEYQQLNQHYLQLLQQVQNTSGIGSTSDLTLALDRLIAEMNSKGEQIRKLRRIEVASTGIAPQVNASNIPSASTVASLERRTKTLKLFGTLRNTAVH